MLQIKKFDVGITKYKNVLKYCYLPILYKNRFKYYIFTNLLFYFFQDIKIFYQPFKIKLNTILTKLKIINRSIKKLDKSNIKKNIITKSKFTKAQRIKFFDNNVAVLYGYKIQFNGRFTRKQRSAHLWFSKGSMYTSAADVDIDYNSCSLPFQYSKCNVKV